MSKNIENVTVELKEKIMLAVFSTGNIPSQKKSEFKIKENITTDDTDIAVNVLTTLNELPMTPGILKVTRIGRIVNVLRKCKILAICNLAKAIVKKWKREMIKPKNSLVGTKRVQPDIKSNNGTDKQVKKHKIADEKTLSVKQSKTQNSNLVNQEKNIKDFDKTALEKNKNKEKSYASIVYHLGETADKFRDKIQKVIYKTLGGNPDQEKKRIELAVRIEKSLFDKFDGDCGNNYRSKLRSITYNLKDPNNPDLNTELYEGMVTPLMVVDATEEELASDKLKKLRKDNWEWMKAAAQCDWDMHHINEKLVTDMFRCGKCGKRRCTFFQKQTRCADEPMTTFIRCMECDNRWRQY